ncbi:hypothetical protein CES85_3801 (plasmid) [Ochrobactrum quorumnocens]|uniref:Uncharacterized protein n=1 Tax=Ochrobactrum quorumnocens TaxID=271865 RepID=A0A248UPD0_9HYPH|nr:hypothetical protein CES85_5350 [[Ochrobactrum] quorumnocens]ASV88241.1 hypothetical protein CES85_3801 [[Ochrobactrum] quorumnocens]
MREVAEEHANFRGFQLYGDVLFTGLTGDTVPSGANLETA